MTVYLFVSFPKVKTSFYRSVLSSKTPEYTERYQYTLLSAKIIGSVNRKIFWPKLQHPTSSPEIKIQSYRESKYVSDLLLENTCHIHGNILEQSLSLSRF